MTRRRLATHLIAFTAVLLSCIWSVACQRAEGAWRGKVVERDGTRIVTNKGDGLDARKVRETVRPLWTIGGQSGSPLFSYAMWADFDRAGNLFVLDYRKQQIIKVTAEGRVAGRFGKRGQEPGGLSKTRRFAWVDGKLYFANEGNRRIEVLGESGEVFPPIQLTDMQLPGEIYFANDRFYVVRRFVPPNKPYIHAYDRGWKPEGTLRTADPDEDRVAALRTHNTVCTAPDGIWIVHMLLNDIEKVGWDGRKVVETSRDLDWDFPKDDKGRVMPEILVHRACAVDPEGNLYVVYSNPEDWKRGNDVYKFAPDGRLRQKAFTLPIFNASMMRFDRQGNLYFSDGASLTKARIERTQEN